MTLANIIAFIKAFPIVVKRLDAIIDGLNAIVTKQLQDYADDSSEVVDDAIKEAQAAKNKEQLRKAARKLANIR